MVICSRSERAKRTSEANERSEFVVSYELWFRTNLRYFMRFFACCSTKSKPIENIFRFLWFSGLNSFLEKKLKKNVKFFEKKNVQIFFFVFSTFWTFLSTFSKKAEQAFSLFCAVHSTEQLRASRVCDFVTWLVTYNFQRSGRNEGSAIYKRNKMCCDLRGWDFYSRNFRIWSKEPLFVFTYSALLGSLHNLLFAKFLKKFGSATQFWKLIKSSGRYGL